MKPKPLIESGEETALNIIGYVVKEYPDMPKELALKISGRVQEREDEYKAAVGLLKEEINGLYSKMNKTEVHNLSKDQVCDLCEVVVSKKIEKAFPIFKEK